jgi:mRNA interferase MazF
MKQTTGKTHPKRGDIYWVSFDPSQGTEIQKTRPAIIISNNMFNKNLNRIIVAPITSNVKNVYDFDCVVNVQGKEGKIMLDQLRTIDKTRLKGKIESVDSIVLKNLEKALKITFDLI